MGGQPQVIVGSQIDDTLAVKGTLRRLRVFEHAQLEMRALLFQVIHLVSEIRKLRAGSGGGGHSYLTPLGYSNILLASPVFRRAMPLLKSAMAMRSVITGSRSSLPALSS